MPCFPNQLPACSAPPESGAAFLLQSGRLPKKKVENKEKLHCDVFLSILVLNLEKLCARELFKIRNRYKIMRKILRKDFFSNPQEQEFFL